MQNQSKEHDIHRRPEGWSFAPPLMQSKQEAAWWKRHEPTIDRWISEMENAGDPWWCSAVHAAQCLLEQYTADPSWERFSVTTLLFEDLWEGGTVNFFGSVEKFFDQLVEALQRFVSDDLIDRSRGEMLLAEMREARSDFLRCYDEATPEEEAIAIARRRRRLVLHG